MSEYNKNDRESIYNYAKKLEGRTFREVQELSFEKKEGLFISEDSSVYQGNFNRKGELGELLEEHYFGYKPDSDSNPDFPEANLELKVTPYKINLNKTLSAKERLVISMIDYFAIIEEGFFESSLWSKLQYILLIYYLYEEDKERLDYIIKYVHLYSPSLQDLIIIINDYKKIQKKVIDGKAHELSEGDTLYLAATTKAANSRIRTAQPNSDISAKPRAYSLKNSYMTSLLRNEIAVNPSDDIIKEEIDDFEEYVINKINKNKGLTKEELSYKYLGDSNVKSKSIFSLLTYRMLGVKTNNASEFEKANIEVKTIRLNKNNKITESMSFPAFKVKELLNETWENSKIYEKFSETKFLFVIYKKHEDSYILHDSMFWNMPIDDLEITVKKEWENVYNIFNEGVIMKPRKKGTKSIVVNNLPKLSTTEILHVRNHSQKSVYVIDGIKYGNGIVERDGDPLPNGDIISKQCFWLNNKYILKQITKKEQKG